MTSIHESILIYRNHRYLKWSALLVFVASVLYIIHSPLGKPNGGTWLGYTLGTIAAGIMLWLAWFGVRKRSYSGKMRLEDWLSAHVYLGLALVIIATLHSGFQFGWNIHSILYFLMMGVVLSGLVGLYFYVRFPRLLTENRRGLSSATMMSQIADLDRDIRSLSMTLDDETARVALKAVRETSIGGSLARQLSGRDIHCPTSEARAYLEKVTTGDQDTKRRQLLSRITKKEDMLKRVRRDIQLRCLLQIWLYVHVPLTFATLAALLAHIITVFYYW